MEEFKKIARSALVPSFYTLLLLSSSILISYSVYLPSLPGIIAGACLIISSFIIIKQTADTRKDTAPEAGGGDIGLKKKLLSSIKQMSIPLIISGIAVLRIISLMEINDIGGPEQIFTAEIENARLLQYTNEIEMNLIGKNSAVSAVAYIPKKTDLHPGDKIEIRKKPVPLQLKNGGYYSRTLARKGIRYIFHLTGADYKIISKTPLTIKEKVRYAIVENIEKIFDGKTAPLVMALYLGNKNFLDKAAILDFRRAGALHILAASGLHLGIIASMVFFAFLPLRINKRILMLITLAVVFFYLYITDMPVSLVRAFVMFFFFAVQYIFNFERNILNTLFLSAITVLFIWPYDLYDLGFQLSFGATLGIIIFFRFYRRAFSFLPSFAANTLAVTVSAQVMVLPVILFQLGEINLTGVLSNLVLIPATTLTLVLSVIANIISPFSGTAAHITAFITEKSSLASLFLVDFFSKVPGHFFFQGNYYALFLPYLCMLSPLLPADRMRRAAVWIFFSGFVFGWALLLDFSFPPERVIALLHSEKSDVVLYKDGYEASIIGSLQNSADADVLTAFIINNNIKSVNLYITEPEYNTLKGFAVFIKKNAVNRCLVSPDAISNFYFKKFCAIIDNDGIEMKVMNFRSAAKDTSDKAQGHPEDAGKKMEKLLKLYKSGGLKPENAPYPVINL